MGRPVTEYRDYPAPACPYPATGNNKNEHSTTSHPSLVTGSMSGLSEEPTWSFPTSPRYWFSDSTPLVFRNDWPDGSEANFLAHDKMMYDATQIWSRLMKYDYNHSLDQGSLSLMPSRASRAFNVWLPAHEAIISDMGFSPFDDSRLNDGDMDSSLGIIPNIPSLPLTIGPMSE